MDTTGIQDSTLASKEQLLCSHAITLAVGAAMLVVICGCKPPIPAGALVVTQTPMHSSEANSAENILDERYPVGSRVVLALTGDKAGAVRVLSKGLVAAGAPVVAPNGKRVFFTGKTASGTWQIYEADLGGHRPSVVTVMEGGAMDPTLIANDEIVFSSPVPKVGESWKFDRIPALYAQKLGEAPRRLTFGTSGAVEPTVLRDGRILFVSAWSHSLAMNPAPSATRATPSPRTDPLTPSLSPSEGERDGVRGSIRDGLNPQPSTNKEQPAPILGLFTINNDGTELTPFALDRDGAPFVRRPRELENGRIVFLSSTSGERSEASSPENVRMARPFASRSRVFRLPITQCGSVENGEDGKILVCMPAGGDADSFAVMRLAPDAEKIGEAVFDDPEWNEIEAIRVQARASPMGHISAINPAKQTGTILCLDANFTRRPVSAPSATALATNKVLDTQTATTRSPSPLLFRGEGWGEGFVGESTVPESPLTLTLSPANSAGERENSVAAPRREPVFVGDVEPRPAIAPMPKAERVRIVTGTAGQWRALGEVPVQPDGSFMAEVPADTPLGFETIDADGRVIRRLEPSIWVRPGENRACLGCHEPHNRSPRNVRPMAVADKEEG